MLLKNIKKLVETYPISNLTIYYSTDNEFVSIRYSLKTSDYEKVKKELNERIEKTTKLENLNVKYKEFGELFYFEVSPPEKILKKFIDFQTIKKFDLFIMFKKNYCTFAYLFFINDKQLIYRELKDKFKNLNINDVTCLKNSCEIVINFYHILEE